MASLICLEPEMFAFALRSSLKQALSLYINSLFASLEAFMLQVSVGISLS
jgi:hypothetical protein